jgi:Nif-specific regulatory protein
VDQLRLERDLYRRLLGLGSQTDLQPFLEEALSLIVSLTGAKDGYLAIYGDEENTDKPRWWIAKGFSEDDLKEVRVQLSTGIIAEAMATGQTIITGSALDDQRFKTRGSVLMFQIREVICAPIRSGTESVGVLYLQDRVEKLPFSEDDRQSAEAFSRYVALFADRLKSRQRAQVFEDKTLPYRARLSLEELVGRSAALAASFAQVESAARFDVGVLLRGAPGTGKTAFARAIHNNSQRAKRPFVELNCAAIPETLIESELFGTKRGAYSGATDREGLISAANTGTLFLDEIGELPLGSQSKLLKFLQSKTYTPLGTNTERIAEVRLIAATNANLEEAFAQKKFREDLYYRLNVLPIRVPALHERREDIAMLLEHFCEVFCARYSLPKIKPTMQAKSAAEEAEWPGNVRQLSNAVEAAVIRAAGASALEKRHLFPEDGTEPDEGEISFQEATRRFQRKLLGETLLATDWNISETSRRLELARSHVHNLILAFELKRTEPKKTSEKKPKSTEKKKGNGERG